MMKKIYAKPQIEISQCQIPSIMALTKYKVVDKKTGYTIDMGSINEAGDAEIDIDAKDNNIFDDEDEIFY